MPSSSSLSSVKVAIVDYCPPSSFATDMKVLKHMWFAKIVPGQSQQDRVRFLAGFESGVCESLYPPSLNSGYYPMSRFVSLRSPYSPKPTSHSSPFLLQTPHHTHTKTQLESFYKHQADLYDSYRFRMLHARMPMIKAMPLPPKGKGVWLDIGGGKLIVFGMMSGVTRNGKGSSSTMMRTHTCRHWLESRVFRGEFESFCQGHGVGFVPLLGGAGRREGEAASGMEFLRPGR